jgi:hypothetical protein
VIELVDVLYSCVLDGFVEFVDCGCYVEACHFGFQVASVSVSDAMDSGFSILCVAMCNA